MKFDEICALLIISILILCGCDNNNNNRIEPPIAQSKNVVLGIDFSIATKDAIARVLNESGAIYTESINTWEEIWTSGNSMKDVEKIKLGITEAGRVAYLQYDYSKSAETILSLKKFCDEKFGNPISVDGDINDKGEYTASWQMGDGLKVLVRRKYPSETVHLSYINESQYEIAKLQYKVHETKVDERRKETIRYLH